MAADRWLGWLFHDTDLGAAIFGPRFFARSRIGRHLRTEADGLDVLRARPKRDQRFAHRSGATFAQAAIVFRGPTFIGETGDNDLAGALLEEARDLLDFAVLRAADGLTIEVEINRLKLVPLDVATEKRRAFLALGQRRAGNVIARAARALAALLFRTGGKEDKTGDENEEEAKPNENEKGFLIHMRAGSA